MPSLLNAVLMYNLVEDINKIMDKYEIWPDLKFKAKNVINDGEATDTNDVVNNYKLIGDNIIFDNKPFNYDEMIRDLIFEIYGYAMGKNRQNSQLFIDPYVDAIIKNSSLLWIKLKI